MPIAIAIATPIKKRTPESFSEPYLGGGNITRALRDKTHCPFSPRAEIEQILNGVVRRPRSRPAVV
jgi:hypothetical protein